MQISKSEWEDLRERLHASAMCAQLVGQMLVERDMQTADLAPDVFRNDDILVGLSNAAAYVARDVEERLERLEMGMADQSAVRAVKA